MNVTSKESASEVENSTEPNRTTALIVCVVVISYSIVMFILILNHFRNNSRLILHGLPVSKKQCQGPGAVLSNELLRLNFLLFLSLLQYDPFPGDRIPASEVSDTAAIFNAAVSGILRQTMRGKSLPQGLEFFRRCLQLLETGYVIGVDEIAAQDMTRIERRIAQLKGRNEQLWLRNDDTRK